MEAPAPAPSADDDASNRRARFTARFWDRLGYGTLLVATAVMYLWNITINGMGNQFYAGAAQAGSRNWEALLFGSLDPNNFITVDKPPVSQWVMGLSGQIFGFSSASMLIPEALMAVAAVALLYGAVRRISGPRAALLAGAALALMPVAALMFRYNNPDAVMVLLMMAAAYCTVRALERASTTWIALAGVALGFAFLAKMLEGIMVLPAIGLVYLIAAPTSVRRRLLQLVGAAAAFLVSAGWFVALTLLWPASSRPYIAGSTDNNFMNLVLGYNGFARVLGRNHGGGGHAPTGHAPVDMAAHHGGFGGPGRQAAGLARLFSGEFGFEIGWLLPAALLAVVLVLIARRRAPRTDLARAGVLLFGGWMLVDGLVLSYMSGMIHPYYDLSLAPAVAGTFAIGVHEMWMQRSSWLGRLGLATLVGGTGVWSWWILARNAQWLPELRWAILVLSVVAFVGLLLPSAPTRRRLAAGALLLGVTVALAGSAAYAVATIGQPHGGGNANVGPAAPAQAGHGMWGQSADNAALDAKLDGTLTEWSAAVDGSSTAAGLELSTNTAVMAIGGFTGSDPVPTLSQFQQYVANHQVTYYIAPNQNGGGHGGNQHSDIGDWVAATFTPKQIGSDTVYDLTAPAK
ncbi:glycosyl transferase [Mycolicibacterium madagascariense]|uniref:Glycosyl transferase n=1 Tax=Mycolicibacterium madagascariense TaxID=212765 RepID=A0A7I7XEF8_9MYCO|nr:glycosyl transferase [Mycolicibacterium madagascariense]